MKETRRGCMTWVDYMAVPLSVYYAILCCCYLYNGQHAKAVYWFGAIVLSIGVLMGR